MTTPHYLRKFAMKEYLQWGHPFKLSEEALPTLKNWKPIDEVLKNNWKVDGLDYVRNKKTKKEFLITCDETPKLLNNGLFELQIKVLNKHKRGFEFSCCKDNVETLNREFWPTVVWLMAQYIAPTLNLPQRTRKAGSGDVSK